MIPGDKRATIGSLCEKPASCIGRGYWIHLNAKGPIRLFGSDKIVNGCVHHMQQRLVAISDQESVVPQSMARRAKRNDAGNDLVAITIRMLKRADRFKLGVSNRQHCIHEAFFFSGLLRPKLHLIGRHMVAGIPEHWFAIAAARPDVIRVTVAEDNCGDVIGGNADGM